MQKNSILHEEYIYLTHLNEITKLERNMKVIKSALALFPILLSTTTMAGSWDFENNVDEFTGETITQITSPKSNMRFSCDDSGDIKRIILFNDWIGEVGTTINWVTDNKSRGESQGYGFKKTIQGYFEILTPGEMGDKRFETFQDNPDWYIGHYKEQYNLIKAMKSGNSIQFRATTYDKVFTTTDKISLNGFSKVFDKLYSTCNKRNNLNDK